MSVVRSFSVGNGDMFIINHASDSFTIIDCCYADEEQKEELFNYIYRLSMKKGITRFISTHPDEDHIRGIADLDEKISICNFYVVKNGAIKNDEETVSFKKYCQLRDGEHSYYIRKDCSRKWLNSSDDERGSAGIWFYWPDTDNRDFIKALEAVASGTEFNNISPVFTYSNNGARFLWMGDMETGFLDKIKDKVEWPKVDVLFAPHHGRESGHVCSDVLKKLDPQIIVLGEAPSKELDYYNGYDTIKQNSAKDITFDCGDGKTDVYVESMTYNYTIDCLYDDKVTDSAYGKYIGSFKTHCD